MTASDIHLPVEQWLAVRKKEAINIDPASAEIFWAWGQIMDPYGVNSDLPEELDQVGRLYFARKQGSEIWVSFCDLPNKTCKLLWARVESGDFTDIELW